MNDLKSELAPRGALRVGLNMSNFLLVSGSTADGIPTGIVPDLAAAIADRVGASIVWMPYDDAGLVADGAKGDIAEDAWDIAFMGAEPARASRIDFTAAYVEIEAACLVRGDSPIRTLDELDRPGMRIASATRAAYTLYLARTLRHAELVTADALEGSFRLFEERRLDALAGLKPRLLQDQARLPGSRLLERLTTIQQSIAVPAGRPAAFDFLRAYAEQIKADGTVARLIARHRIGGLSVARPVPPLAAQPAG